MGRRMIQYGGRVWGKSKQFQDLYSREMPTTATPFGIFKDAWSSAVPGFQTGTAELFDDFRIRWLEEQYGSFAGKRVLELGPLEGGHTCMMERSGASVTAIEASQRGFLKCLVVKDAFHLKSEFLYGDFRPYLEAAEPLSFDFVLAVGVLYHMLEPLKLLHDIARVTNSFGLWTHYFDPAICRDDLRFSPNPVRQTVGDISVDAYEQHYLSGLATKQFIGGTEPTSRWMTREGLLASIQALGFEITPGDENLTHQNGPCILLLARRG
jgi:SAM-dependent methyltransferase